MIVGFRVSISNPELFEKYTKLVSIQNQINTTKKSSKQQNSEKARLSSELEGIFAKLNQAVNVESGGGKVSPPDFNVTSKVAQAFYAKVFGSDVVRSKKYVDYLLSGRGADLSRLSPDDRKLLEQADSVVGIEAKVSYGSREGSEIGGLKVFNRSSGSPYEAFFDVTKDSIIDSTQFSLASSIRNNIQSFTDTIDQTLPGSKMLSSFGKIPSQSSMTESAKEVGLMLAAIIEYTRSANNTTMNTRALKLRTEFQGLVKAGISNASQLTSWNNLIDKINQFTGQVEISGTSDDKQVAKIVRSNKVFDLITSIPELKAQFYQKSKILQITWVDEGTKRVELVNIHFPLSSFKSPPFEASIKDDRIVVSLSSKFEKEFIKQLMGTAENPRSPLINIDGKLEDFHKELERLSQPSAKFNSKATTLASRSVILVPHDNSIRMSVGKLPKHVKEKLKKWPKLKKVSPRRGETKAAAMERANNQSSGFLMNTFLSNSFLTSAVIQWIVAKMPNGPIGGRPKSKHMLTYRTGVFANSLRLFADYRTSLITYYYNPIYYVHESTGRDPRKLITQGIRAVIKQFFSRQFSIVKGK